MHIIIVLAIVFVVNKFVYKKKSSSVKTNSLNNLKVISSFSKARTIHIPSYLIDCNDPLAIYLFSYREYCKVYCNTVSFCL